MNILGEGFRVTGRIAAIALVLASLPARVHPADPSGQDALIEQAFTYGFPVYEMMRVRFSYLEDPKNPARLDVNGIAHGRALVDPTRRVVTTPNNDTLYSRTILDLSVGPVSVHVPDTQGRYYSLAFYDIFSNAFAYVGRRTTGTREGSFVVVGPGWNGELPANARVIRAPCHDVLVLTRVLVDGEADLPSAHAVQDGVRIAPLRQEASKRPRGIAPLAGDPATFIAVVNQALGWNGVPSYEQPLVKRLAAVGVCGTECSWAALPRELQERWRQRFPGLLASLRKPIAGDAKPVDGWYYNPPQIGNFGTDYAYRATVALSALLAMEPAEAVYPMADADTKGRALVGDHRYRLHVPASGVPVDAFWSLSMYELTPDGRAYFTDNPIRRYAIGDRTRGLARNPDGSIDLWLQHAPPGKETETNWLPAPTGRFIVVLRGYQPRAEFLDSRFRLPGIERVE